jgi:aspartyl-tRNA(Asn)/glutamyl-tRNA(Gln) amidotransferase subunit A
MVPMRDPSDPVGTCHTALRAAGGPTLRGSFIVLTPQRAAAEAHASAVRQQAGLPIGPLDGLTVVWKDVFDVAGTRTTAGSITRRYAPVAATDAPVVHNLSSAGAICLGKSNLSEFAFSGLGLNPHFGNPVNPRAAARIPGGSSSGSAVAVATGVADIGIGTDTSGSVRVPAAFCGIVGFKASPHRYDVTGMLPLAPSLDSIGVLAPGVAEVSAVDAALRAVSAPISVAGSGAPARIVVPEGEWLDDCTAEISTAFHTAMSIVEQSGIRVEHRRVAALERAQRLMDRYGTLVVAEAFAQYGHLLELGDDVVDPLVLRRLAGHDHSGIGERVLRRSMPRLRAQIRAELDGAILAYPTVRDMAPKTAELADPARAEETNRRVLRSTMVASYLGLPGVALPHGRLAGGLRGSVLLSAPCGDDNRLLAFAASVEKLLTQ